MKEVSIFIDFTDRETPIPSHHTLVKRMVFDLTHPNLDIYLRQLEITKEGKIIITTSEGLKADLLKYHD